MESSWLWGFSGGMLIGGSALLLMRLHGKIAGISGILGGLLTLSKGVDRGWRLSFLLGLPVGAYVIKLLKGGGSIEHVAHGGILALAGFLVGVGTGLGSGCTSGHGICGISRLSPRSFAATLTFMVVGFLTVGLLKGVLG